MACLKNIIGISLIKCLRNTYSLPSLLIDKSLHFCATENILFHRKYGLSPNGLVKRSLFTVEALGIDKFENNRNVVRQQYSEDLAESFRSKMQDLLDRSRRALFLIGKEDLQHAIYLSDDKEEHLDLVKNLSAKYCQQNSGVRLGSFEFGPILLRLCYVLERPDLAIEMVFSPELAPLFNSTSSYQLLMSLLYRHKQYSEVLDLMDKLSTGRLVSQRYPRSCVLLALASALQMGPGEGYTRGLALAESSLSLGNKQRRFCALAGTLALQAGKPDTAIQLLKSTKWPNYYTIKNILLVAWCELGRLDQVMELLLPITQQDSGALRDEEGNIFRDTYTKVKTAVQQQADLAITQQFAKIERTLMDRKLITDKNLVECVLLPVEMSESSPNYSKQEASFYKGSAMRRDRDSASGKRRRESFLDDSG